MAFKTGWKALPGISQLGIFVNAVVDNDGYQICLTDLCRLWMEKLSKADIMKRALSNKTAIDPNEGDDQYDILLDKLKDVLRREAKTEISVHQGESNQNIVLRLAAPLPYPLPPLEWTAILIRQGDQSVASELVLPLLLHANHLSQQIQQLLSEVRNKDNVISKITSRLETSGQDLSLVFPNVSNLRISKKKSQREQYAPYVKGLAEFDVETLNQQIEDTPPGLEARTDVLSDTLESVHTVSVKSTQSGFIGSEWWRDLPARSESTQRVPDSIPPPQNSDSQTRFPSRTSTNQSDQHQDMSESFGVDDSTTEGDDDVDRVSPEKDVSPLPAAEHSTLIIRSPGLSTTSVARKSSRIGQDDEARRSEASPSDPSAALSAGKQQDKPRRMLGGIGGIPSNDSVTETRNTADPFRNGEVNDPGAKLGGLGGRSKPPSSPGVASERGDAPSPAQRPRLGGIGGKAILGKQLVEGQKAEEPQETVDSAKSHEKKLVPRASEDRAPSMTHLNPEERANQNRDQLKREMEAKSNQPTKKRRKF